jgi:hypothetical protein
MSPPSSSQREAATAVTTVTPVYQSYRCLGAALKGPIAEYVAAQKAVFAKLADAGNVKRAHIKAHGVQPDAPEQSCPSYDALLYDEDDHRRSIAELPLWALLCEATGLKFDEYNPSAVAGGNTWTRQHSAIYTAVCVALGAVDSKYVAPFKEQRLLMLNSHNASFDLIRLLGQHGLTMSSTSGTNRIYHLQRTGEQAVALLTERVKQLARTRDDGAFALVHKFDNLHFEKTKSFVYGCLQTVTNLYVLWQALLAMRVWDGLSAEPRKPASVEDVLVSEEGRRRIDVDVHNATFDTAFYLLNTRWSEILDDQEHVITIGDDGVADFDMPEFDSLQPNPIVRRRRRDDDSRRVDMSQKGLIDMALGPDGKPPPQPTTHFTGDKLERERS